jgi:hypothetical protein
MSQPTPYANKELTMSFSRSPYNSTSQAARTFAVFGMADLCPHSPRAQFGRHANARSRSSSSKAREGEAMRQFTKERIAARLETMRLDGELRDLTDELLETMPWKIGSKTSKPI